MNRQTDLANLDSSAKSKAVRISIILTMSSKPIQSLRTCGFIFFNIPEILHLSYSDSFLKQAAINNC